MAKMKAMGMQMPMNNSFTTQHCVTPGEAAATRAVSGREVEIGVELGLGKGAARVCTCDLTHGYIDINGSYRS